MRRLAAKTVVALAAGLVALGPLPATPARERPNSVVATLSAGEHVFWRGPDRGGVHRFRLGIEGKAAWLRVLADTPWGYGFVNGSLVSPSGFRRAFTSTREAFVPNPEPGTWTVVADTSEFATPFRMRAKLETRQHFEWPHRPVWLKPNLRSMPPFEFTFANPTTGEAVPLSCHADEMVEEGGRNCLRFSVGPENVGAGRFELYLTPLVEATAGEATVYQRIFHGSRKKMKVRDAGTYEYHKTHGHYHYAGFASLKLLRVAARGRLVPAGTGKKIGFCTADVLVAQFHRFAQEPVNSAESDCNATDGAWIGLSRGWTDVYDWATSGNYVEFGDNDDGLYVVRSAFDTRDLVDETNERDNHAYALIEVTGTRVKLLERGYGRDPWDPRKRVVRPWWED